MTRKKHRKNLDVKINKLAEKVVPVLQNRMFVIVACSILLLAVLLGVYSIFILRDHAASDAAVGDRESENLATGDETEVAGSVEVLPQQKRTDDDEQEVGWTGFEANVDPFADPMKLTGVVTGGRSGAMAIIESSGTSYIVAEGDYVDDLWAVRIVTLDYAVLRAHNQEVTLFFDQPPVTRSLDPERESDEDDAEEGA